MQVRRSLERAPTLDPFLPSDRADRNSGATVRNQSVLPQHGFAKLQTHLEGMRRLKAVHGPVRSGRLGALTFSHYGGGAPPASTASPWCGQDSVATPGALLRPAGF
ncbi:hypothetical protein MSG28_001614 [Choristoneura fumiferana]|uniref:Uncharacterized protein n=1 Tax=Choristoneura fumiferana TaxID=7141 RepID=A0ACC0KVA6_CHOFU|nr:hypothetical protein MSG28_001614 [Choristoneura fumiferana]